MTRMTPDDTPLFSKEALRRNLQQELRRQPRPLEYRHWSWGQARFLQQEEELELYLRPSADYESAVHFYCRTVVHPWRRDGADLHSASQREQRGQEWLALAQAPPVERIPAARYHELTRRIQPALPAPDVLGNLLSALTIGPCDWESTVLLSYFEHQWMLIHLVNLA